LARWIRTDAVRRHEMAIRRSSGSSTRSELAFIRERDDVSSYKHESDDEIDERGSLDNFEELEVLDGIGLVGEVQTKAIARAQRWKWWKVYALHLLFMWNSRTYEYASVSQIS
jgi:hypothetical protein